MNKNKLKTGFELYKEEVKGHKWTFAVYVILRSLVVAIGVVSFFRGYYENMFYCILSLVLFLLPAFVTKIICRKCLCSSVKRIHCKRKK